MGGGLVADEIETGLDSLVLGQHTERTLVLVGRTGNGKSATGNSILGERKFRSKARGTYITEECELQKCTLQNGHKINIIDTPGLFSACSTTEFTSREIVNCLLLAKDGIDALLLVFSLKSRLTDEEQSTLQILKILFGSQIVDYIIVVFTNGDALEDGETLDDYLEGCPEFEEILKECGDRKVLFDNSRYVPQTIKEKQVSNHLQESLRELKEQLSTAEARKQEAEEKMNQSRKLSADEIGELRQKLNKAMEETANLRAKLDGKGCTIL